MSDNFPDTMKQGLLAAVLASLASEEIELEEGAVGVITSAMFGEAEIPLN